MLVDLDGISYGHNTRFDSFLISHSSKLNPSTNEYIQIAPIS
jgi:hypothetical protein